MPAVTVSSSDVRLTAAGVSLAATLSWPQPRGGVVVFAHGSGSSRFSPRNRFVANDLQGAGLATLLLDLLTPEPGALEAVSALARDWFREQFRLSAPP